jgi:D-glycero-D-manno-heptose 1,7-bisphosphate phosphatase
VKGAASAPRRAVFLDRDGTLIRERDGAWILTPDDVELLPGAADAVRRLNDAGLCVVLVTNQSAVGRGLLDEAGLARVHARLAELLARAGARLDRIEHCPDHPTEGVGRYRRDTDRRKPGPGMLRDAAAALGLDLAASWTVGDAERDLAAGAALGVPGILVLTGKGAGERERMRAAGRAPRHVAPDLAAAVRWLLAHAPPGEAGEAGEAGERADQGR